MRRVFLPLLAVFALLCWPPGVCRAEAPWRFLMEKDGIKVFGRPVPGSDIAEVQAVSVMDANIVVVGEALRDVEACKDWLPGCAESKIVHRASRNDMTVYMRWEAPWPFSPRDMVLDAKTKYELESGRCVVDTSSHASQAVPVFRDIVRISDYEARYLIQYLGPGKTGVVLTCRFCPGGNVPDAVVNWKSKYDVHDTLLAFSKFLHGEKYARMASGSEDERLLKSVLDDEATVRELFLKQLSSFVGDPELARMVAGDKDMVREFVQDGAGIGEVLFYGRGSKQSRHEAAQRLLGSYLRKNRLAEADVKSLVHDPALIARVVNGAGLPANRWREALRLPRP